MNKFHVMWIQALQLDMAPAEVIGRMYNQILWTIFWKFPVLQMHWIFYFSVM